MSHDWGYEENNGPVVWPQKFPIASAGKRQSPIDIITSKAVAKDNDVISDEDGLRLDYPQIMPGLSVQNTGHGWKVDIPDEVAVKTSLTGGPLLHKYRLAQFHCHWGRDCSVGSEHTVDGKSYAAELHFVHWNTELFSSPAQAMPSDNGLAVLGVFLEVGQTRNYELDKLLQNICMVQYKGEQCNIAHNVEIAKLLPENRSYWTYPGSLTTPPLWESVTWIVFTTPIQVTEDQIAKFREICFMGRDSSFGGNKLIENYRLTQPVHDRTVTLVKHY